MDGNFKRAYNSAVKNVGVMEAVCYTDEYFIQVNNAIDKCINALKDYENCNTDVKQLKGNIFEAWHAETYNIDSVLKTFNMLSIFKEIDDKVVQNRVNGFASIDISTPWADYGLKDFATDKGSAFEQAISYLEYYKKAKSRSKKPNFPSIEEYYKKLGIDNVEDILHNPIYEGQLRLIPKDQLKEALEILRKKVIKETSNRPDQAYRYIETYNNLVDRIYGPNNTESIPMTREQSEQLAKAIKDKVFNPKDEGLVLDELMQMEYIVKQCKQAALSAATLTFVLTSSREIVNLILKFLKAEKISVDDFVDNGINIISSTGISYIRGYLAALITCQIKKGEFGNKMKNIDATMIGTFVALVCETISKAFRLAKGSISQQEFDYECFRNIFISVMSLGGSALGQAILPIPFVGTLFGNFIGAIIGSLIYESSNTVFLSFCISTGYSFLGFVEQNYELPDKILKEIGLDIIDIEKIQFDEEDIDSCEMDICDIDSCRLDYINTYVIRRGVIAVNKIGYVLE